MIQSFQEMIERAKSKRKVKISVAMANDDTVIEAISQAAQLGFVDPILVGPRNEIETIVKEIAPELAYECIDADTMEDAAKLAVQLVSRGDADVLMKGLLDTSILLKQVLNKEYGLRTGNVLSHAGVASVPAYHKLLFLTDCAMNIAPDAKTKAQILENVLPLCHAMGLEKPKVAILAAKEKVSDKMQATLDAQELLDMQKEGAFSDAYLAGPFALDNAISKEAAEHKGIQGEVAGDADVLLLPQIEAGNILYKALTYLAGADIAGIILGARRPIVLTSRADAADVKVYSIAMATLLAQNEVSNG